jgi:starch synthase
MHCLYLTQELAPYFAEGGLGLTAAALPHAIQRRMDVTFTIILPYYPSHVERAGLDVEHLLSLPSQTLGGRPEPATIWRAPQLCGPNEILLVRSDPWYARDGGIYRDRDYVEYADAVARSAFFGSVVVQWVKRHPGRYTIVHGNDWQSGMALFLLARLRNMRREKHPRILYEIHSAEYRGDFMLDTAEATLGLSASELEAVQMYACTQPSMMLLAMRAADALVTCSPTYARELFEVLAGTPMLQDLERLGIIGVVSGVDAEQWDPAIPAPPCQPYTVETVETGKQRNKLILQEHLGLMVAPHIPLYCICSRLVPEKGIDLVIEGLSELVRQRTIQLAVMGLGEPSYRTAFTRLQAAAPKAIRYCPLFDLTSARLLYAGSDFTLMPSRTEPCGLNQLIAMRYGTLPVASRVGGLNDTVIDVNQDKEHGTGFLLETPTARQLLHTVEESIAWFHGDPDNIATVRRRVMRLDWSWERSAAEYSKLYGQLNTPAEVTGPA